MTVGFGLFLGGFGFSTDREMPGSTTGGLGRSGATSRFGGVTGSASLTGGVGISARVGAVAGGSSFLELESISETDAERLEVALFDAVVSRYK